MGYICAMGFEHHVAISGRYRQIPAKLAQAKIVDKAVTAC
jgi:hypothetical protein